MGELISAIKPNFKNRSGFGAFSRKTALTKSEFKFFGIKFKILAKNIKIWGKDLKF